MDIQVLPTEGLTTPEVATVRGLLSAAFGERFSDDDWDHAVGGRHIVARTGEGIVGHAAVVPRRLWIADRGFDAGYVEAVATRPDLQRRGVATQLTTIVDEVVRAGHEIGALSTGAPTLYERLGWRRWKGASYVRRATTLDRSADEDDGIMVLLFGPSNDVDVTADIVCAERRGDDW
jgi:aminoglycoside 2'-N-acetyltransferase I